MSNSPHCSELIAHAFAHPEKMMRDMRRAVREAIAADGITSHTRGKPARASKPKRTAKPRRSGRA